MHQRGPAPAPLGDLGQPDRIGLVGLGPPWHVLDVAGVDQPAVEPLGLQQVEDPFPVGRSRLHHHPGDPPAVQPVGQLQQRRGGSRIATDLLQPPARPGLVRHPHTRLQRCLAQIERSDPLDMQLLLVDLFHLTSLGTRTGGSPAGASGMSGSRTLVLVATMRSPRSGSQRQTELRPSPAPRTPDVSGRPARFSRIRGVPRDQGTEFEVTTDGVGVVGHARRGAAAESPGVPRWWVECCQDTDAAPLLAVACPR
jgi:hypothetical protein